MNTDKCRTRDGRHCRESNTFENAVDSAAVDLRFRAINTAISSVFISVHLWTIFDLLLRVFAMSESGVNKITEKIIGCAFRVSNTLGAGFLEKVYENALAHELRKSGLAVLQQHPVTVFYDDVVVGEYFADLLVEGCVIVELKALAKLDESHFAQSLNYLKATGQQFGLLLNFGTPRIEVKRVVASSQWNEK